MVHQEWGVMIYEHNGECYYHSVRADRYEGLKNSMESSGIFKTGKNNLNEEEFKKYMYKARQFVLRSMYSQDNNVLKSLKELWD
mgnify:FL=1